MVQPSRGFGGGVTGPKTGGGTTNSIASSPALITSTGGLSGAVGALLTPVNINQLPGPSSYIMIHDTTNFDCEEDSTYYFRQEVGSQYEGQYIEINKVILKYRELGVASFTINISAYQQKTDDFKTIAIDVDIPAVKLTIARKKTFPDGKIHIINIAPPKGVIQGINPQCYISRKGNSGPMSITKLILCTYADEVPQI